MILNTGSDIRRVFTFPRTRGGDPVDLNVTTRNYPLFPARAGVILSIAAASSDFAAFPRIRGGDPNGLTKTKFITFFSPHTRG